MEKLVGEIKLKRRALGATPKQFASFLGLKPTEANAEKIMAYERGEACPTVAQCKKLAALPSEPPFSSRDAVGAFTFIDLFAGIGGIRLPFQDIGGKCVFTSEWDKDCQKTYAANFGEVPNGDITKISAKDIPPHDLLLAGFPCQAFSQAGLKKGFLDTRGTMFFEVQRIIAEHRPSVVLLENVKQLVGHDKGNTLNTILGILKGNVDQHPIVNIPMSEDARKSLSAKLNYAVSYRVLVSDKFGVPQKRERVFIMALNKDVFGSIRDSDIQTIFDKIEDIPQSKTVLGDVLEQNSSVDPSFTISDKLWNGHQRRRKEHREKGNGFGYSLFNRDSRTCNTISQRYYKDGSEVLIDQSDIGKNPRLLMPRECARIQGFPESFIIDSVSKMENYRQFGNSVSVPVVRAIAKNLREYLK
ncbi:MAG: DNA (cytosine-5-)-methyltransferase [Porticoccaceae bacterium]|nr:DNA (cytosine-5-)-methyltransferase [Porticoccaceae bacterium]